jgi:hypothetical protein
LKASSILESEEGEIVYKVIFEEKDINEVITDKGYFYVTEKAIIAIHRIQKMNDMKAKTKTLTNM